LLLWLLGILLSGAVLGDTNRIVRVGAFQYYPGIFKDKNGAINGFYVEMLEEIAQRENWTIQYFYGTWAEGLTRVKNGQVDILTSVAHTEERDLVLDYTQTPLLTVWGELYVREGKSYDNILEMAGKKIAIMKDDFNGASFQKLAQGLRINCDYVELGDFDAVFQAIVGGSVDGGVVNSTYGTAKQRSFAVKTTGVIFHPFDIHFASLKGKNTDVLLTLNEYLDKWQRDKNSVYHVSLRRWGHGMMEILPSWAITALVLLGMVAVASAAFIVLLRVQVHKATCQIRLREARLRTVFESAKNVSFVVVDADRRDPKIVETSPGTDLIFACKGEEILGKSVSLFFHGDALVCFQQAFESMAGGSAEFSGELTLTRASGDDFRAIVNMHPLHDRQGAMHAALVVTIDISERIKAENHLRESEERYRRLFETCQEGIWTLDSNFKTTLINRPMADMLGYAIDEIRDRTFTEFLMPEELIEHEKRLLSGVRQRTERFECRFKRKDSLACHAIVSTAPVQDKDGRFAGLFAMCANISEFRRLEEQLRQAQKMEAIGQLAGGIAHDFNNILAAMLMNMSFMRYDRSLSPEALGAIKELESEANRAATLVRQLLMFSRRSVVQIRPVYIDEIIENLLKMLQRLLGENIALEHVKNANRPQIDAYPGMIEQVLMNLTVNARDAMPKGGRLSIATTIVEIADVGPETTSEARPGCYACLSVADTGCGMDDVVLKRIFEPFYTTKDVGRGTGLGLATVYGIVKQHRGWIEVQSKLGLGSAFRVFLPISTDPEIGKLSTSDAKGKVLGGHEVILLVEDEAVVRKNLGMNLRHHGYQVLEASNAVEALGLWIRQGNHIDLLFTDMVMPEGVSGLDLADRIKAEKKDLKVIVSSGYSLEAARQMAPTASFLQKPFEVEALLKMIRTVLDEGRE
jgi:PAS domain S-box-containing protein